MKVPKPKYKIGDRVITNPPEDMVDGIRLVPKLITYMGYYPDDKEWRYCYKFGASDIIITDSDILMKVN